VSEPASGTVVDANVLLDVLTEDPAWLAWSSQALADAADMGRLVINPVVYAEVSVRFSSVEDLDAALPATDFVREPIPWPAAFLAGKCFVEYRRRGGTRRSPVPDFFIGAHAAVRGLRLLTRDPARYRSYLPALSIVAP
jgi:predicted nucleic acid-binding protein